MIKRPRRLRKNETIRNMVAETAVNPASLVYPLFVKEGSGIKEEIPSMPGQFRFSIDELLKEVDGYAALGLKSILLFGIPDMKDEMASSAYDDDGIIQRAVRALKARFPELYVITDVCLCEYMSHGHCGILKDGEVDNDATLELLAKTALSHAIAGADMVAPSDMMDGRVAAIREKLDENGFKKIKKSNLVVRTLSVPVSLEQSFGKCSLRLGAAVEYNFPGITKFKAIDNNGAKIKETRDGARYADEIKTNQITFNAFAALSYGGLGFYVKYNPKEQFVEGYGPRFTSITAGVICGLGM